MIILHKTKIKHEVKQLLYLKTSIFVYTRTTNLILTGIEYCNIEKILNLKKDAFNEVAMSNVQTKVLKHNCVATPSGWLCSIGGCHSLSGVRGGAAWNCDQRWNSRTNSWVEVSGHNLESF
jgi:hypothetical protein